MSLQVWLPLNGDLHNQGLNNITLINNTADIDNNGKIGKCYSFSSGKSITYNLDISKFNSTAFSFSCWIYISSWNSSYDAILSIANGTGWNSSRATLSRNNTASTLTWNIANNNTSQRISSNTSISLNTWTHIATTYDGTKLRIYINGILDKEGAANLSINYVSNFYLGTWNGGTSYPFNGKLNDVRIYNHCLSQKEVEEISKGLILHYKLDNIINNIIYDYSGYNHNGSVIGPFTFHDVPSRYEKSITMNNTNTANHIECNDVINLPTNGITVSFWAYTEKTNTYVLYIDQNMSFAVNAAGTAFYVSRASSAGFPITAFKTGQWNHVVLIRNENTYKAYINGQEITRNQANNNWSHNVSNIYLLNRNYNNNYAANASISDFRMYATELTEDQIKELYNTSATIDNNGNIYAREFIENDNLNITKTGLFQTSTIEDNNNGQASIFKTKKILGTNLYEY